MGPYSAVAPLWITDFAPVKDIATEVTWHPGGSDETLKATYTIGEVKATILTSMNIPDKITLLITELMEQFPLVEMTHLFLITIQVH